MLKKDPFLSDCWDAIMLAKRRHIALAKAVKLVCARRKALTGLVWLALFATPAYAQQTLLISSVPTPVSSCVIQRNSGNTDWVCQSIAAASQPFSDSSGTALVANASDPTKLLRFDVSAITTGTKRVWTVGDTNLTFPTNSTGVAGLAANTFTGLQTLNGGVAATTGTFSSTVAVTGAFTGTTGVFSSTLGVTGTSTLGVVNAGGLITATVTATSAAIKAQASSSGDTVQLRPNAAGSGGDVATINNGGSAYVPMNIYGSTITLTPGTAGAGAPVSISAAGLLTVSGFGTHSFSAGGTGGNILKLENTTNGTGNYAEFQLKAGTNTSAIDTFPQSWTTSGANFQNGMTVQSVGAGGLSVVASSGPIRFYSGGTTLRATLQTAGTWTWAAYGAGTITSDASGNLTSVSDERMKDRIAPLAYGLAEVLALKPIQYGYNAASGLERDHLYGGFSAQNVQTVMPLAVGQGANGFLTLQDRPILAAAVNAIKELSAEVDMLRAQLHPVATSNVDPNASAKLARKAIYAAEKLAGDTNAADQAATDAKRQKREAVRQCRADNELLKAQKLPTVDCTPDSESKALAKAEDDAAKAAEKAAQDAALAECRRIKKLVEKQGGTYTCKAA